MAQSWRTWLVLCALWSMVTVSLPAQPSTLTDRPTPAVPLHPPTRQELDRREALRLYGKALLQERASRLIEAIDTLERALRLDPESPLLHRTLVPLYLAVDRSDDALKTCRVALDLDPGDGGTWFLLARQYKIQNRTREAIDALVRAAACPTLKEHSELRLQVHSDLAGLYEASQEFAKAEAALTQVLALLQDPEVLAEATSLSRDELPAQLAETYERLGHVCVRAKHYDKAVAAYRKAQQNNPRRAQRLAYNLADVYLGEGKLDEALGCINRYLETQPQGIEAYEQKIHLLERLGREKEIVPALQRHAQQDEQNGALKLLLARQYGKEGQRQPAEEIYQKLARETPTVEIYRGLFTLYREQFPDGANRVLELVDETVGSATGEGKRPANPGDAAKARAMLVVLREDGELVKAMLPLVRQRLLLRQALRRDTCRFLALLATRAHQLGDAEQLYRSCLTTAGNGPRPNEPEIYSGLLRVLWQEHKYEEIVEVCRQGLGQAQVTNLVLFHVDLSRALVHLGKNEEAIAEATRAVDIAAEDEQRLLTRRNRVIILAQSEQTQQAVAECQGMLKDFKKSDEVHEVRYTLSLVYSLAKDFAHVEEQLRFVLKEWPNDATAHNDLGYIWADQGKNLVEAEKLIRKALELDRKQKQIGIRVDADNDEENAAYLDSLGWVLFKRGRLEEARQALEKACRLPEGADDPVVWDHAGDVYHKLKETARARTAWQKAAELCNGAGRRQPDDRLKDIQHKLKLLETTLEER